MRIVLCLLLTCAAGCLDSAMPDTDMGLTDQDMAVEELPDLKNADLTGLLNCAALNAAENMCKATNATCVMELRKMATPQTIQKDEMLQQCFHMYCPLNGICMPNGNGDYTANCVQCVQNTLQASATACTPAGGIMGECTKCYNQGQACIND
jgi:hypothetical protein